MAVVGGGPAGAAAAITLARHGAGVVLVERSGYEGPRIGETLPPEVRLLLDRLGVWDRFTDDGHMASPGIVAAWGHPEPYATDFITNPYGSGWRVDRDRFDAMLAGAARDAGAAVLGRTRVDRCAAGAHGGWDLSATCDRDSVALSADLVVDATGRASPLRRSLGGRRVMADRLVGVVGFAAPVALADRRALIEATEHGWWYSAPLPDGRLVLSFQTDARAKLRAAWTAYLAQAPLTAARSSGATVAGVRVVPASSQRCEPAAGDGWLAAGDAAAAHDPLTGLGIFWALESGIAAAEAVVAGDRETYARCVRERFDQYLAARTRYYRVEHRWPDAPFWSSRRRGPGA